MSVRAQPPWWQPWRAAMAEALYGAGGFYRRERPAAHFRTSVHASRLFADAVRRLADLVDESLGRPDSFDVVDVGAGGAGLLRALLATGVPDRWRLTAVEVAEPPAELPDRVRWRGEPPSATGLVVANEWLDTVPVDVVEQTADGPRLVLVDPASGTERLGPHPCADDEEWLARWWPLTRPGDRAEVGRGRDAAWASTVERVRRGLAVAIDYGHRREARPPSGTLAAYRAGAQVPPVPDGSCDVTAHVALDAAAAAGEAAGAASTVLTTQREALRALGVRAERPPLALARRDPRAYLLALQTAGEVAELTDPAGLGGFGWLVQPVGMAVPPCPAP
ncbi:MAG: SAM-dependent methyltransferase [Mycobacterium leprae]